MIWTLALWPLLAGLAIWRQGDGSRRATAWLAALAMAVTLRDCAHGQRLDRHGRLGAGVDAPRRAGPARLPGRGDGACGGAGGDCVRRRARGGARAWRG